MTSNGKKIARRRVEKPAIKEEPTSVEDSADRTDDVQVVRSENRNAGPASDNTSPKIHAKVVNIHVSVGTSDRARLIEDLVEEVKARLDAVPFGEDGLHVSTMSQYYILDGKVCLTQDYDPNTQNFKKGATPPRWAGGPAPTPKTNHTYMHETERRRLTREEFAAKYPNGHPDVKVPKSRKQVLAERAQQQEASGEEIEFEWDEFDMDDESKHEEAVEKSTKTVAKKLKKSKGKK